MNNFKPVSLADFDEKFLRQTSNIEDINLHSWPILVYSDFSIQELVRLFIESNLEPMPEFNRSLFNRAILLAISNKYKKETT